MKRKCSKCSRPWIVSIKSKDGKKYTCPYCSKKDHFFVRGEAAKIKKYQFRLYFKLKKMSRYRS